jgi:glycosyltransferase involved in cell wall biosynthesis
LAGEKAFGFLSTESCSHGGIQSFTKRVAQILSDLAREGHGPAWFWSLNDTTAQLKADPAIPGALDLWGAGRRKAAFVGRVVTRLPRSRLALVGHLSLGPPALAAQALGRIERYAVIIYGTDAWERLGAAERIAAQRADRIISISPYTSEQFAAANDVALDRIVTIPLCADEQKIAPDPDFRLNGDFRLLCVSRMPKTDHYKGFDKQFLALARLKHRPGIHLNLIGDGDNAPDLKALAAELGVAERVTFWGRQPDSVLAAAYAQCDVFSMPSAGEGFGIVFVEAMLHGKPCIGGNHGGTTSVIEHGESGFLVQHGDIATLASLFEQLEGDRELCRRLGARGLELARTKFSLAEFQRAYRALILDLLGPTAAA